MRCYLGLGERKLQLFRMVEVRSSQGDRAGPAVSHLFDNSDPSHLVSVDAHGGIYMSGTLSGSHIAVEKKIPAVLKWAGNRT